MSLLLRFLGLDGRDGGAISEESPAIRRIAEQLDRLEPGDARFFAAFAYVLARVAGADLRTDDSELLEMRRTLVQVAKISAEEAELVVEIASSQADELGATDNYLVTREFRHISSREQRVRLLECLYAVAAADDTITGDESGEIMQIAQELGLARRDALAIRAGFKDKLAEFRRLPGER